MEYPCKYIFIHWFYPFTEKGGCEYLPHPEYGKVKHRGLKVGDKAAYSCDYGYKLVGERVRKCLYDGSWSGEEPKCTKSKLK